MKLKIVFAAFVLMVMCCACNTTEKLLCRNWKIVDVTFDPQNTLNLPAERKAEMVKQLKDTSVITLRRDKTYSFKLPERLVVGTWKLEDKTITTTTDMTVSKSVIKKLDKNTLILESNDNNTPMTYILSPLN